MTHYKFSATIIWHWLQYWLQWVAVTTMAITGAWGATPILLNVLRPFTTINEDKLFGIVAALALGVFIGILQWWILKLHLPQAGWWIVTSISGYIAALFLFSFSNRVHLLSSRGLWDDIALMSFLGIVIGVPQYLVLRPHFRKAGWWVVASALGMQSYRLASIYPAHNSKELIGLGFLIGVVIGATTGIIMVWVLHANSSLKTSPHFRGHAA